MHNTPSSNNDSGDEAYAVDAKKNKAAGNSTGRSKGSGSAQAQSTSNRGLASSTFRYDPIQHHAYAYASSWW